METLTTPEELGRAEAAGRQVFQSFDGWSPQPFRDTIEARLLIYPIDYTMLEAEQFAALAAAAATVGDLTAYVVPYGARESGWEGTYDHSLLTLDDYLDYKPPDTLIIEHLLYSPRGAWGVVTSHGEYAAVGGAQGFVDTLRRHLPQREDEAVEMLVREWREIGRSGGNVSWLRPLIAHLYGEDRAARVWDEG
jgi:hypothetical protein